MCNGVSPLAMACCNNEGHMSRIYFTKFVVDSNLALRVGVDSNPTLGVVDSASVLRVVVDSDPGSRDLILILD
jgi:hypothetical protein